MKYQDPLHDGTITCYIMRFFLSAFMGFCVEILLAGMLYFVSRFIREFLIDFWWVCLSFPILTGIYGIFKFDHLKEMFEDVKDSYSNNI